MKISGQITYQDIEGGFWGIISEAGDKFVPIDGLPDSIRIDGLSVDAEIEPVQMFGTAMWGRHVRVISIGRRKT
jgi:hypothetical protein